MRTVDVVIVGAGPAGLTAAISCVSSGSNVLILERNPNIGGQLIKQSHMFFGSEKQYASTRGFKITDKLLGELEKYKDKLEIYTNATVLGIYEDGVVTYELDDRYEKIKPKTIIVATGANEDFLSFSGNDLPGVYGAGAVQTLMNVYGVVPGKKVLMIGAGNIGLIVSYQLLQAGVDVVGVLVRTKIKGYLVHASKLVRMGVPILSGYTIKEVEGKNSVEKAIIIKVDENRKIIEGTEKEFDVDTVCVSVGLSPLVELLGQAGCEIINEGVLGGYIPRRNKNYQTTVDNIFVAGDVTGIEEASSAMVEGYIAGLNASKYINNEHKDYDDLIEDYNMQLKNLRSGPHGMKIQETIDKLLGGAC